jgi:hypothetical protein
MPKFKKGESGNPKGRAKGTKTKFTSLKESFIDGFNELGGTQGLIDWVKAKPENQGEFYKMITKLFPREIKAEINDRRSIKDLTNDELFGLLTDDAKARVRATVSNNKKPN